MTWRYGITRDENGYYIREIYDIVGFTRDPITPFGETPEELIKELERMLEDAKKYPILDVRYDQT